MTETRSGYIIPSGSDELSQFEASQATNIAMTDIAKRLDRLEGIRGIPQTAQAPIMADLTASRLVGTNTEKQLISQNLAELLAGAYVTIADDGDGTATISIPQSVATTGTPEFAGVNLPITNIDADYTVLATDGIVVVECVDKSSTVLLVQSNTTDGSATFTDSSPSAKALTASGSAIHETDVTKFGSSGMFFPLNGLVETNSTSADFNFGSGKFTIHGWLKGSSSASADRVMKFGSATGEAYYEWKISRSGGSSPTAGALSFSYKDSITSAVITLSGTIAMPHSGDFTVPDIPADKTFDHFALIKNDDEILRLYINGVADSILDMTGKAIRDSLAYKLRLGYDAGSASYQGYMDEIHILKGVALWDDEFTPPTASSYYPAEDKIITLPAGIEKREYTLIKSDENTGTATIKDASGNTVKILTTFREVVTIRYINGEWIEVPFNLNKSGTETVSGTWTFSDIDITGGAIQDTLVSIRDYNQEIIHQFPIEYLSNTTEWNGFY